MKLTLELYLIVRGIKIPPQLLDTLIFFSLHGVNTDTYKMLIANKIAASIGVVQVYKSRLATLGLIYKVRSGKWEVLNELKVEDNSSINIECSYGREKDKS